MATRIAGVSSHTVEPYVGVLAELASLQASLRRLETYVLRLMNEAGISDEEIGTVQDISSQAVGKKRRRRV